MFVCVCVCVSIFFLAIIKSESPTKKTKNQASMEANLPNIICPFSLSWLSLLLLEKGGGEVSVSFFCQCTVKPKGALSDFEILR